MTQPSMADDGLRRSSIVKAYTRLYTDAHGESRFEDVELPAETGSVVESDLIATLAEPIPAKSVIFRNVIREASDSDPHNAPRRQFIIQVTGTCEIETSTGETRRFGPGEVLLVEDLDGRGHITRAVEPGERMTLLIPLAEG
jgi:hypothetical protein